MKCGGRTAKSTASGGRPARDHPTRSLSLGSANKQNMSKILVPCWLYSPYLAIDGDCGVTVAPLVGWVADLFLRPWLFTCSAQQYCQTSS